MYVNITALLDKERLFLRRQLGHSPSLFAGCLMFGGTLFPPLSTEFLSLAQ